MAMGGAVVTKADEADVAEVLRLQGVLRERHAELDGLDDDDDGRTAVMNRVFAATDALVKFEARLPLLRDERRRKVSSVIVYAAAGVAAAAMLTEVVLMFAGRVSWWYLIALVPTVALAVAIGASERGAPTAGHRGRAAAAVTVVVAAILLVMRGDGARVARVLAAVADTAARRCAARLAGQPR